MISFLVVTAVLAAEPEKLDVSAEKPSMHVYTDGKKHYLVASLDASRVMPTAAYYGDGKSFYKLRSPGGGGDKEKWSMSLWEPRANNARASLDYKAGAVKIDCMERATALTELKDDEANALLDNAAFFAPRWTRVPSLTSALPQCA